MGLVFCLRASSSLVASKVHVMHCLPGWASHLVFWRDALGQATRAELTGGVQPVWFCAVGMRIPAVPGFRWRFHRNKYQPLWVMACHPNAKNGAMFLSRKCHRPVNLVTKGVRHRDHFAGFVVKEDDARLATGDFAPG